MYTRCEYNFTRDMPDTRISLARMLILCDRIAVSLRLNSILISCLDVFRYLDRREYLRLKQSTLAPGGLAGFIYGEPIR